MIRNSIAALCGVLMLASLASAQAPRFRWQTGQVLVYRTEHNTVASYVMGDNKSETKTRVQSTKRWQVIGVDNAGVATLQMSLQALFFVTTPPSGEPLVFDSAHLDKCTPELRKQYENYIGLPLVVLRIDGRGKVIEVKEARPGYSAAKYESDPPFKLLLPAEPLKADLGWEHAYQITLEPPLGTGEKVPRRAALRLQGHRRQPGHGEPDFGGEGHAGGAGGSGAALADAAARRVGVRRAGGPAAKSNFADRQGSKNRGRQHALPERLQRAICRRSVRDRKINRQAQERQEKKRKKRKNTCMGFEAFAVSLFFSWRSGALGGFIFHPNNSCTAAFSSCNSCSVVWNFCWPKASSFTPSTTLKLPLPSLRQG